MTDDKQPYKAKRKDKYEPPQAVRLTDGDRAFGDCGGNGSTAGYRAYNWQGACVTGHAADDGCHAGSSVG
jgi:hypothetical protein